MRYEAKFRHGDEVWFLQPGLIPKWVRATVVGAHGVFCEPSYVVSVNGMDWRARLEELRALSAVEKLGELV